MNPLVDGSETASPDFIQPGIPADGHFRDLPGRSSRRHDLLPHGLSYQSSKQYGVLEGTVQSTTVGSSPTVVRLSPVMTGQDSSRRKEKKSSR